METIHTILSYIPWTAVIVGALSAIITKFILNKDWGRVTVPIIVLVPALMLSGVGVFACGMFIGYFPGLMPVQV